MKPEDDFPRPGPGHLPLIPGVEIELRLGRDEFTEVYRARQVGSDQTVAIKVLSPALSADADVRRRFLAQGQALTKLVHPNIVRVLEVGGNERDLWVVTEDVAGESLARRLEAGSFNPLEVQPILTQICSALQAAHGVDIEHGNLKPENILLTADGRVRVANFGLGQAPGGESDAYLAPELQPYDVDPGKEAADTAVDWRADIFSLGALSYHLLCSHVPSANAAPPSSLNPELPPALDQVVFQAMAENPEERPQSTIEFLDQFSRAFEPPPPPPVGRWLTLAALFLLAFGGIATAAFFLLRPDSLTQGLVLHYSFDEQTADPGLVLDLSGLGHHGRSFGNASFEPSPVRGRSLRISNVTSYVQADHPTLDSSLWEGGSFSVWVKLEAFTAHNAVFYRGAEQQKDRTLHFQLGGNSSPGSSPGTSRGRLEGMHSIERHAPEKSKPPQIALHTWHHYAATWDDEGMVLYTNGVKNKEEARRVTDWKDAPDHVFWIGKSRKRYHGGWFDSHLNGWVDDVRLYNRRLEEKEILRLFNQNPNLAFVGDAVPLEIYESLNMDLNATIEAPSTHRFATLRLRDAPVYPQLELDGQSYKVQGLLRANGDFEPNTRKPPETGDDSWVYLIPTNTPAKAEVVVSAFDAQGVKTNELSRVPVNIRPAKPRRVDTSPTDEITVKDVGWTTELVVGPSRKESAEGLVSGKGVWELRQASIRPKDGIMLVTVEFEPSEREQFWPREFSIRSGKNSTKTLGLIGPEGLDRDYHHRRIVDKNAYVLAIPAPPPNARAELQFLDRRVKVLPRVDRTVEQRN